MDAARTRTEDHIHVYVTTAHIHYDERVARDYRDWRQYGLVAFPAAPAVPGPPSAVDMPLLWQAPYHLLFPLQLLSLLSLLLLVLVVLLPLPLLVLLYVPRYGPTIQEVCLLMSE